MNHKARASSHCPQSYTVQTVVPNGWKWTQKHVAPAGSSEETAHCESSVPKPSRAASQGCPLLCTLGSGGPRATRCRPARTHVIPSAGGRWPEARQTLLDSGDASFFPISFSLSPFFFFFFFWRGLFKPRASPHSDCPLYTPDFRQLSPKVVSLFFRRSSDSLVGHVTSRRSPFPMGWGKEPCSCPWEGTHLCMDLGPKGPFHPLSRWAWHETDEILGGQGLRPPGLSWSRAHPAAAGPGRELSISMCPARWPCS